MTGTGNAARAAQRGVCFGPVTQRSSVAGRSAVLAVLAPVDHAQDIEAVTAVLKSGWITTGAQCAELERAFAAYTGARHAVALTSATAGLHVLLRALGIGPGDEVVTPSMTWASTPNMIVLAGATPVWVDVDVDTLMTTADRVEAALTEKTKLIIPVHFAGAPLDLEPLRALASRRGIPLVEDSAHVAGAAYAGREARRARHVDLLAASDQEFHDRRRRHRLHGRRASSRRTCDACVSTGSAADTYQRETQGRAPQAEVIEPGVQVQLARHERGAGRESARAAR